MSEFLELLWTIISLFGALYSFYGILGVVSDLRELGPSANGKRTLGIVLLQTEGLRLIIQMMWLLLGILLLVDTENEVRLTAFVVMLLVSNSLLTIMTFLTARVRQRLRSSE